MSSRKNKVKTRNGAELTFKQKVQAGMLRKQFLNGEITWDQIPEWARASDRAPLVKLSSNSDHVHSEHCSHE